MINIKDLTIDEKITLLTGKDCWRINDLNGKLPTLFVSDGPNGLRKIAPDGSTVGLLLCLIFLCLQTLGIKKLPF